MGDASAEANRPVAEAAPSEADTSTAEIVQVKVWLVPPCRPMRWLEAIALVLRAGALADPFEDLAAWVAGVEVIKGLKRVGFTVVRSGPSSPVIHRATGARGAVQ